MIDVKELRIGSKVNFKGGYYTVIEIRLFPNLSPSGYWLTLEGYNNPVHVLEVEGVDIEIDGVYCLKKFGFKWIWEFEAWRYKLENGDEIIINRNGYLCSTDARCIIKHVHQLQNIFFDLTGKEL